MGKISATTNRAFSCHSWISPCISSHFWVANCTSRCISYLVPSTPALTSEKAFKVPNAVMVSTFRSALSLRRLSGIPCRSRTAISDSISAARGFCLLIKSKDIFQVLMTELWLCGSLLRSPRSSFNRSCKSASLLRKVSKYFERVMSFWLINAAACVIARGMYPRASSRYLD